MTNNNGRAVAPRPAQSVLISERVLSRYGYTPEQKEVLAKQIGPSLSDAQILYGLEVASARGLDVLKKEVYLFEAKGRVAIVPSIEGLRVICERSGLIDGPVQLEYCGPDGAWLEDWISDKPPTACRATLYRKDSSRPYRFTALWREFHRPLDTWQTYGTHMLGIVAERHLRKRAVPELVRDLDIEQESVDDLEHAAIRYMYAVAHEKGWTHDQVHQLIFGIAPKASLKEEIDRRGMDWRDAAQMVTNAIEHAAPRTAIPERAQGGDASMLYRTDADADPVAERHEAEAQAIQHFAPPQATDGPVGDDAAVAGDELGVCSIDGCNLPADGYGPNAEALCEAHLRPVEQAEPDPRELVPLPPRVFDLGSFLAAAESALGLSRDEAKARLVPLGRVTWTNLAPGEMERRWEAIQSQPALG